MTQREHVIAGRYQDRLHLAERIARQFVTLPGVVAVALGGSLGRAVPGTAESVIGQPGDVDLYVYAGEPPPLELRRDAVRSLGGRDVELDRRFWETDDAWVDGAAGVLIEVMYRAPGWIEREFERLFVHHEASIGCTTSLADNVHDSVALADPTGWYAALQRLTGEPYPMALRDAIVAKNYPILRGTHASFRDQIASAIRRQDTNAVAHRTTALLTSFWDILFAINLALHPGEKRLVAFAEQRCPNRPDNLGDRISAITTAIPSPDLLPLLDALLDDLDACIVVAAP